MSAEPRYTGDALDGLLLDVKLSVPEPRGGSVSRIDLITAARESDRRVVGVTAPAGYGKSTFLAEWAAAEDRSVEWVSLDRFDDDPGALVSLLASAHARGSSASEDLVAAVSGIGVSAISRGAPRLASAFGGSPTPFVLMIDDLHELQNPACHDVLDVVLSGIPQGSQVVAASRSEQRHLPRLRASGDGLEIGASELTLDATGAARIFAQADVSVTQEFVAEVTERTEGWPAGLYLAALIAADAAGETATITGDDPYVADYLYRESLLQLPAATQRFLRRTAVLDQLCAPLCDAVVGAPGAKQQLRDLEASSLFLIPLDRRRHWYRYHALYREFLLSELDRVEPDAIPELHLRAADWCEANGSPTMAIEHLLHTTEQDRCLELVTALLLPTYRAGQISTTQRWLATLGDSVIDGHLPLVALAGWHSILTGQAKQAQRWASVLDTASFDHLSPDDAASLRSKRAILRSAMCSAGPERAMTDAHLGVELEPSWSPWRDPALYMYGQAHLLAGDPHQAGVAFTEASVAAAPANPSTFSLSEADLGLLAMERGRWAEAVEHVERALAAIDEHQMHDYATSVLTFAAAARLAVHRGDLKEAGRQLTRAMRARPLLTVALPVLAVRVRLHLAKVFWSISDRTTARHLLREIDDILIHRPGLGAVVDELSAFREVVTSSTDGASGPSPLSPAELRLLPYLQTHLTIREIAQRLFVSRNTVASEVSSIYRKLGVSSRSAAVDRAMEIGLLGG